MKKKRGDESLSFPTGLTGGDPYITLCGFESMEVDGCREILTYEDTMIRLAFRGGTVTIVGTGLVMRSFFGSRVEVVGKIDGIEYLRGGGDDKEAG